MWYDRKGCASVFNELKIAVHKSITKVYKLPYWHSSHEICERADILTFPHLVNLRCYQFLNRILYKNNAFLNIIKTYVTKYSSLIFIINQIFFNIYGVQNLLDNDRDAIIARIYYVDRHRPPTHFRIF
jgi:hypothetical protein